MTTFKYICEEVERQGHGRDVDRIVGMSEAWDYARDMRDLNPDGEIEITMEDIIILGRLIEPIDNVSGFRRTDVTKEGIKPIGTKVIDIESRMHRVLDMQGMMTPREFYKEFEIIHPFSDGNGRVGKILFNWKNNTLENPKFPIIKF